MGEQMSYRRERKPLSDVTQVVAIPKSPMNADVPTAWTNERHESGKYGGRFAARVGARTARLAEDCDTSRPSSLFIRRNRMMTLFTTGPSTMTIRFPTRLRTSVRTLGRAATATDIEPLCHMPMR